MTDIFNHLCGQPGFFLLAGPCVIEGEEMAYSIGRKIKSICEPLGIAFAFKGSYRKANRSRLRRRAEWGESPRESVTVMPPLRG